LRLDIHLYTKCPSVAAGFQCIPCESGLSTGVSTLVSAIASSRDNLCSSSSIFCSCVAMAVVCASANFSAPMQKKKLTARMAELHPVALGLCHASATLRKLAADNRSLIEAARLRVARTVNAELVLL